MSCRERSGEKSTHRVELDDPTAAMISATRTGSAVAISPPMIEPMGIVPHTMKRIVAFIRLCIASGVIDCRRLIWATL